MNHGEYVYCFIEGRVDMPFDLKGVGGYGDVYFLNCEGITAAISDVPYSILEPSRENALAHEKIIQSLLKYYNLVPCSFGNVFKCKEDINTFISKTYEYLKENLDKVRDKMEVGLRVFWKKPVFSEEIETKEIKELRDMLLQKNNADNYYLKIDLGKMVEAQVSRRRQYYSDAIFEPLANYAVEAKLNDTVNPLMVLNASFLIQNSKEQEFDNQVGTKMKKFEDRLDFSYSGPWPPYNFTSGASNT
jgi:hypothetical protein